MSSRRNTVKAFLGTSSGTLVSRILGLCRDMAMASLFGVSAGMDAFFLALLIPNLFRRVFGEGALSGAVVPVLSEYRVNGDTDGANRLVSRILTRVGVGLTVLMLIAVVAINLIPASATGFEDDNKWRIFVTASTILSPLAILMCIAGVLSGVVNASGKFALPAALPGLQNAVWIVFALIAGWLAWPEADRITLVCYGVLLGGVVVTAMQFRMARNAGYRLRFDLGRGDGGVSRVTRAFLPTVFTVAAFQINTLVDNLLAEWLVDGHGAVSAYAYANRLFQFPLGVVAVAMGTAAFPMLSRYAAKGEPAKVTGGLLNGLRLLSFIVLPAAAGLVAINSELVSLLFQHGEFDATAAERTARVLVYFSIGLPMVAALGLVVKAFHALQDMKTPMRVTTACIVLNFLINLVLVQTPLQEAGLALATAISSLVNLVILGVILRRRLRQHIVDSSRLSVTAPAVSDRMAQPLTTSGMARFRLSLLRSLVVSIAMLGAVRLLLSVLPPVDGLSLQGAIVVAGAVAAGAIVYTAGHWLLRSDELRELRPSIRRRRVGR